VRNGSAIRDRFEGQIKVGGSNFRQKDGALDRREEGRRRKGQRSERESKTNKIVHVKLSERERGEREREREREKITRKGTELMRGRDIKSEIESMKYKRINNIRSNKKPRVGCERRRVLPK
jgi:hypothetical protein